MVGRSLIDEATPTTAKFKRLLHSSAEANHSARALTSHLPEALLPTEDRKHTERIDSAGFPSQKLPGAAPRERIRILVIRLFSPRRSRLHPLGPSCA